MRDPAAPPLVPVRTPLKQLGSELAFRRRQVQAFGRAALGRGHCPKPLIVFTTSRSGSTWLTELLFGINQCGPLPEHLRPQHFEYALHAADGAGILRSWLQEAAALIRSGRDGGSKLIWDFFPDLLPASDPAASRTLLAPLLDLTPTCFRLRRRDRAAQAVSRYRSSLTGVFHRSRQTSKPPRAGSGVSDLEAMVPASIEFDAEAIARHEDILRRADSHLDATVTGLGLTMHEVVYEELVAAPLDVLMPIAAHLRGDLGSRGQLRRVQRALDRALLVKAEDSERDEWQLRYRAERGL